MRDIMMCALAGMIGAGLIELLLLVGRLIYQAGKKAGSASSCSENANPVVSSEPTPTEEILRQRKKLREDNEAFTRLMKYNTNDVYGLGQSLEEE